MVSHYTSSAVCRVPQTKYPLLRVMSLFLLFEILKVLLLIVIFVIQPSCLQFPSKIQRGQTLCIYDSNDGCSLRPPPTEPVFIILVALLTAIISIPIIAFLQWLITGYARAWPGGRAGGDKFENEERESREISKRKKSLNSAPDAMLRNSTFTSAFGRELKKGLRTSSALDYHSAGIVAQMAYAGTHSTFNLIVSVLVCGWKGSKLCGLLRIKQNSNLSLTFEEFLSSTLNPYF